jgi:hypothetical protein
MPRLLEPINQLIPQVLPIRANAVHSRQYLRPSRPQRSVVQRGDHAAWALPCGRSVEHGKIEYGGLPVSHAMFPNYLCDNSFRDATYDDIAAPTETEVA